LASRGLLARDRHGPVIHIERDNKALMDRNTSPVRLKVKIEPDGLEKSNDKTAVDASPPELRTTILDILRLICSIILPIIVTVTDGFKSAGFPIARGDFREYHGPG
jgi:hypothetical protein